MAEKERKVLIITYYWPPSGGSGVQRWLKFVKYLPATGWQPFVFTPENPSFSIRDESLLNDVPPEAEVLHFPIWEPYDAFFRVSKIFGHHQKGAKPVDVVTVKDPSLFQRFSTWLRANFFIPDPRIFWVKPSVRFLSGFLEDNNITTVITTGPPHSLHLIGLGLKKINPRLRWLADFRDPWSEWGLLDSLKVGARARAWHRKLEAQVLHTADEVLTITPFYVRHFEALGKRNVQLLTNGFDEDDFQQIAYSKADRFIIRHIGIINEKCDPRPFLEGLQQAMQKNPAFASVVRLEFIGEVHSQVKQYISHSHALRSACHFSGNIPHRELLQRYGNSSLLLLILTGYKDAEGYLPGKLFEYLATGLPVMGVGPENGDAATVLRESGSGQMLTEDRDSISRYLLERFEAWKNAPGQIVNHGQVRKYSRKAITETLAGLL